jgi:hypothetical protein
MSIRQTQEEWDVLSPAGKTAAIIQARAAHVSMTSTINRPDEPVAIPGKFFSAALNPADSTTTALTTNNLCAHAMYLRTGVTVDRVQIGVTSVGAGGSTCRVGLYNFGPTFFPKDLIVDCGTIPTDAVGIPGVSFSPVALSAGWVAVVYHTSAAPTLTGLLRFAIPTIPDVNPVFPGNNFNGWILNTAFAPLPSVFPVSAAPASFIVPQLIFRVA